MVAEAGHRDLDGLADRRLVEAEEADFPEEAAASVVAGAADRGRRTFGTSVAPYKYVGNVLYLKHPQLFQE